MSKPKPATAGEKIECKRAGISLQRLREWPPAQKNARTTDRAIARAVKAERLRCSLIVLYVASDQNEWILSGWDPRKDDE